MTAALDLDSLHGRLGTIIPVDQLAEAWPTIADAVTSALHRGTEIGAGAANRHVAAAQRVAETPDATATVEAILAVAHELRTTAILQAITLGVIDTDDGIRTALRYRLIDREVRA